MHEIIPPEVGDDAELVTELSRIGAVVAGDLNNNVIPPAQLRSSSSWIKVDSELGFLTRNRRSLLRYNPTIPCHKFLPTAVSFTEQDNSSRRVAGRACDSRQCGVRC